MFIADVTILILLHTISCLEPFVLVLIILGKIMEEKLIVKV